MAERFAQTVLPETADEILISFRCKNLLQGLLKDIAKGNAAMGIKAAGHNRTVGQNGQLIDAAQARSFCTVIMSLFRPGEGIVKINIDIRQDRIIIRPACRLYIIAAADQVQALFCFRHVSLIIPPEADFAIRMSGSGSLFAEHP